MAVIWTRTASTAPTAAPSTRPAAIHSNLRMALSARVTTTAMSIPAAPNWLPLTAVRGRLSRFSPRMNSTAATR